MSLKRKTNHPGKVCWGEKKGNPLYFQKTVNQGGLWARGTSRKATQLPLQALLIGDSGQLDFKRNQPGNQKVHGDRQMLNHTLAVQAVTITVFFGKESWGTGGMLSQGQGASRGTNSEPEPRYPPWVFRQPWGASLTRITQDKVLFSPEQTTLTFKD